ncbi:alkene reductase [Streptomyces sp. NPDC020983]|uniref:oxidoreductase n=1 Tax=Streptomyces sp. NPDC020983 TaxID=3365106 RepID=UPI00378C8E3E
MRTPTAPAPAPSPVPDAHGVPPLLRPAVLGELRLPNRVLMAPATRARATAPGLAPTELHAAYYAQRAGAGLLITEGTWISREAVGFANVPGVYSDEQVAGWRRVTSLVHALGGRIVLQLWHCGAVSHPDLLGGAPPLGPSAVDPHERAFTPGGFRPAPVPRAMTPSDIARTLADYAAASANARRAGFDGVEVHALGPYLIPQFLNPRLNLRTDGYGGTPAGRRRFLLEVVEAVAGAWDGRRVGVRLSPRWASSDRFPADASTDAEYAELVAALNDAPLAYLHLRGPEAGAPDLAFFARYRALYRGPLIANLGFTPSTAAAALAGGHADAVSFAAHFIANPDLVTRIALGLPLSAPDEDTYYTPGPKGYTDYPQAT